MSTSVAKSVVDYIELQAEWRERKSAEFPDDDRNARSAGALREFVAYLRAHPERIDPRSPLARFVDPDQGTFVPGELVQRAVARHGFDDPVPPSAEFVIALGIAAHRDELAMQSRGVAHPWWPLKGFRRVRDSEGRVGLVELAGSARGVFLWRFPEDAVTEVRGQRTRFIELEAPFEGVTYDGVDLSRALVTIEREGEMAAAVLRADLPGPLGDTRARHAGRVRDSRDRRRARSAAHSRSHRRSRLGRILGRRSVDVADGMGRSDRGRG